jgi:hypothetical protein
MTMSVGPEDQPACGSTVGRWTLRAGGARGGSGVPTARERRDVRNGLRWMGGLSAARRNGLVRRCRRQNDPRSYSPVKLANRRGTGGRSEFVGSSWRSCGAGKDAPHRAKREIQCDGAMRHSDGNEVKPGSQSLHRHGRRHRRSQRAAAGVGWVKMGTGAFWGRFGRVARTAAGARSTRAAAHAQRSGSSAERQGTQFGAGRNVRGRHGHGDHGQEQRERLPTPILFLPEPRHPLRPAPDPGSHPRLSGLAVVYRQDGKLASPSIVSAVVETRKSRGRFPVSWPRTARLPSRRPRADPCGEGPASEPVCSSAA